MPTKPKTAPDRVRFSWDIPTETNDALELLTDALNVRSKADVLRKAVALLLFVHERQADGKNLGLVDANGKLLNLITVL